MVEEVNAVSFSSISHSIMRIGGLTRYLIKAAGTTLEGQSGGAGLSFGLDAGRDWYGSGHHNALREDQSYLNASAVTL